MKNVRAAPSELFPVRVVRLPSRTWESNLHVGSEDAWGWVMRFAYLSLVLMFAVFTPASYAWDGAVSGTVAGFDVTDATNFAFRVYLNGVSDVCGGSYNVAYINAIDSNYNTYVAAVMFAKANGSVVTLYTNRDASGLCKIGYLSVRG